MTKEQWVKIKKEEYKNDRSRHTFKELGIEDRIKYDANRAKENDLNSGYYIVADNGAICDISEEAMAVGYIYLSSDYHGDIEKRLRKGGRLATGDKSWVSTEV